MLVLEKIDDLVGRPRSIEQGREALVQAAREHDRSSLAEQRDAIAVDHVNGEMPAEHRTVGESESRTDRGRRRHLAFASRAANLGSECNETNSGSARTKLT